MCPEQTPDCALCANYQVERGYWLCFAETNYRHIGDVIDFDQQDKGECKAFEHRTTKVTR